MVESTCFQHTSSHPDKYNNSVDRIISKEEEREDPRRELQSIFEYSGVSTFLQELQDFFEYSVFYKNYSVSHAIQQVSSHPVQITTRHLPATVPVSPSILHGRIRLPAPYSIPGLHSTSRLPVNSTR